MDRSAAVIGVKGISKGAGATFVSNYLDYFLNRKDRQKVFVSRPDRFRVIDDPDDLSSSDLVVSVIDPLPSLLMEGAAAIREIMEYRGETVWVINRDNQGVNRRTLKKYLGFLPEYSQEEIPRETICRAEYNCVELPEIAELKGIEELAEYIAGSFSQRI